MISLLENDVYFLRVAALQRRLRRGGHSLIVDGKMGPKTREAFGGEHGLEGGELDSLLGRELERSELSDCYRGEEVVRIARTYLGQEEKRGNRGFLNSEFESLMRDVGWFAGAAWCDFFAELVYSGVYLSDPESWVELRACFTGSTIRSFQNFKKMGILPVVSKPVVGALVYWQHSSSTGHVGIVVGVAENGYEHISGNTNINGGREGYVVGRKWQESSQDRRCLGFVIPVV